MKQLIAIVFGFILVAKISGQTYQQCDCATMDKCMQTQQDRMTTCGQSCASSFTTGGNAAFQCMTAKMSKMSEGMSAVRMCIENAVGRPCKTNRVRRADNMMMSPFGGPGMGMGNWGMGDHGDMGMMGPFNKGITLTGPAKTDVQAYHTCVFNCMSQNQPTPSGRPMWGGHQGRGFGKGYDMCPQMNNCYLAPPNPMTIFTTAQSCFNSTRTAKEETKRTFCTCMQSAYSAGAAGSVTCNFQNVQG